MRRPILILLLSFWCLLLWAGPVSMDKARQAASTFLKTSALSLKASPSTKSGQTEPCYYVFNREDGGFIIISGDDAAEPVLAYSESGKFSTEQMPENLSYWTGLWEDQISQIREKGIEPTMQIREKWANVGKTAKQSDFILKTAKWGQSEPFNLKCQEVFGEDYVTGCVATAASIIMRYHQWPAKGTGTVPSYEYLDGKTKVKVPAHKLGSTYSYKDMPLAYEEGSYTLDQGDAVANLMYDIGTASKMEYSEDISSTFTEDLICAMTTYMHYSKQAREAFRENYTDREWFALLRNEIQDVGPILYGGSSEKYGGHQFLLDGYDATNYFHINWGWEGENDGFYLLSRLNPDGYDFSSDQSAVIGLKPDKKGTSTPVDYLILHEEKGHKGITMKDSQTIEKGKPFTVSVGSIYNVNAVDAFTGVLAVGLYDKNGSLKAIVSESVPIEDMGFAQGCDLDFPCLIKEDIEPGDRLRPYYKGEHGEGFITGQYTCYEYIMLSYENHSEAEIAKATSVDYDAKNKELSLNCQYPAVFSLEDETGKQYSVDDLHYKNGLLIPIGKVKGKSLNVTIQSGDGSYTFTIQL